MKLADNTLQDRLNPKLINTPNTDIVSTFGETPPKYYQQWGPLVPISTPLASLDRHISHQQEIKRVLRIQYPGFT